MVVIGGGITGLATAYWLRQAAGAGGRPRFEVLVLEADRHPGGKLRTEYRDGFLIEAGPDSFLTTKPAAVELCRELGLEAALIPQLAPRAAYVLRRGRLVSIPPGMRLVHPTRPWPFLRSPLLSLPGRLRALAHPFTSPAVSARGRGTAADPDHGDESIGSYVSRRYGAEMLRVLGEPLLAGIHLADPWQLSLEATFPALRTPTGQAQTTAAAALPHHLQGSALARLDGGVEQLTTAPPRPLPHHLQGGPFASLQGGMEQLVGALGARLGEAVHSGSPVAAIRHRAGRFHLRLPSSAHELVAAAVVLTTPAAAAARLVAGLNPRLAELLAASEVVSSAVVTLGFSGANGGRELHGSGFVVPRGEGSALLACTWSSSKWPGRAPAGGLLVRAFLGGWRHPELPARDDRELILLVRRELAAIMGDRLPQADPVLSRVHRWPGGTPVYAVGHRRWLERVTQASSLTPGLWLAGAPYDGVGIPDCVRQARHTAAAVAVYLGAQAPP